MFLWKDDCFRASFLQSKLMNQGPRFFWLREIESVKPTLHHRMPPLEF